MQKNILQKQKKHQNIIPKEEFTGKNLTQFGGVGLSDYSNWTIFWMDFGIEGGLRTCISRNLSNRRKKIRETEDILLEKSRVSA